MFYKFEELFYHLQPTQFVPLLVQELKLAWLRLYKCCVWLDVTVFVVIIDWLGLTGVFKTIDDYDAKAFQYLVDNEFFRPGTWYYKYLVFFDYKVLSKCV